MAKYNRLLRIEDELGDRAVYAGVVGMGPKWGKGKGERGKGTREGGQGSNFSPHTPRRDESRLYITPHTPNTVRLRIFRHDLGM
ncbi:hypothetical protein B4U84_11470 [Westiellopsis prolifica IICB1]|nr:hypothetical protein B4U84_11470 [Westiellopsis prolifica IICB1]